MVAQYRKGRKAPWVVQVRNVSGKVVTSSFGTKEAAEEFEKSEREKRRRQRKGLSSPREEILFIDFVRSWIERRYQTLPRSTVDQDNSRLRRYWLPLFCDRPLEVIRPEHVLEELDRIQFKLGHSAADRNRHRALLHKLFHDAFMQNKIEANPVARIPLIDERKKTRKASFLKPEEQERYLEGLYAEGNQFWILGIILLYTGARIGSAIAAQYHDVDFEAGIFRVRRLLERASGTIVERQKDEGEDGETIVPLFPRLREAILTRRAQTPYNRPHDFIAARPDDGRYIAYERFRDAHRRVILRYKLSSITVHDLRRTFATNAIRAGYSKSEVKEMLGHSTELVTEKYTLRDISHLVEKGKRIRFGDTEETCQPKVSRIGNAH